MTLTYLTNLRGWFFLLHDGYQYPAIAHPNKDHFPTEVRHALGSLTINILPQQTQAAIYLWEATAEQYLSSRPELLAQYGVEMPHVRLFDLLIKDARDRVTQFLQPGVKSLNLNDPEDDALYHRALKVALEYYYYEPVFDAHILQMLREQWIISPQRPKASKESIAALEAQSPMRWDEKVVAGR